MCAEIKKFDPIKNNPNFVIVKRIDLRANKFKDWFVFKTRRTYPESPNEAPKNIT